MKILTKSLFVFVALAGLWSMSFSPEAPLQFEWISEAEAVVGRPLTPGSVGGVARRTTRRTVAYTSSTSAAAAEQQAAAAQQQAAAEQQASANRLPAGTVVTALPSGCQSTTVDGVSLFNCGGVMYQPKFQSNNLVYVVL